MLRIFTLSAAVCAGVCMLIALSASAASAAGEFTVTTSSGYETANFTPGSAPAAVTGEARSVLAFEWTNTNHEYIKVKCSQSLFEGTTSSATATDLTLTPAFNGCTIAGVGFITTGGCKFTLTGTPVARTFSLGIAGCTNPSIGLTFHYFSCWVAMPEQVDAGAVTFTNEGSGSTADVLGSIEVGTMKSTGDNECFAETSTDTHLSGSVTLKAFHDEGSRQVSKEEHTYFEVICGTQVSLKVSGTPAPPSAAITAEQKSQNIFEVTNTAGGFVKVKCSVARFEGRTESNAGTELTLTPIYSSCTLGGLAASVKTNGCKYVLTATGAQTANVDIAGCTSGKTITVLKGNCTINVPEQGPLVTVTFTNEGGAGSTMDALATADLTSVKSTQTGSECPAPGLTSEDGKYTGTVTVRAFTETGPTKTVESNGHTYGEEVCGVQVSFTVD